MKKFFIATAGGTTVFFFWGAFSHLFLLIGTGFTPLPDEDRVMNLLQRELPAQGLYFFPGKDLRHTGSPEQETRFEHKFKTGPVGMLVYRPIGGDPLAPGKLVTQFICDGIASWVLAMIGSLLPLSYWRRVMVLVLPAVLACASVGSIYWNWYEFPLSFFVAQCIDQVAGCFLAALLIIKLLGAGSGNIRPTMPG